jgi:hypothetical protein
MILGFIRRPAALWAGVREIPSRLTPLHTVYTAQCSLHSALYNGPLVRIPRISAANSLAGSPRPRPQAQAPGPRPQVPGPRDRKLNKPWILHTLAPEERRKFVTFYGDNVLCSLYHGACTMEPVLWSLYPRACTIEPAP